MTARQGFEGALTEMSKIGAPSLLLEEFNYYFNKALQQYINKRYTIYDINQQTSDDLRVLKGEAKLTPVKVEGVRGQKATYEVNLPSDYLHLLNCICVYELQSKYKCYKTGDEVPFAAKRLTSDSWSAILGNIYNRPLPQRPYYYLHNVNSKDTYPYNPIIYGDNGNVVSGTDMVGTYNVTASQNKTESDNQLSINNGSNFSRVIKIGDSDTFTSTVDRAIAYRYGNPSNVRMEIRYGNDCSVFKLVEVQIDYIKTPQTIELTQEQIDLTDDTSQLLEYPDYVCNEIINELVLLLMERVSDNRLGTHVQLTQSIANPASTNTAATTA